MGTEAPPHDVAGNIMLHCLEGQIVLGLAASETTALRLTLSERRRVTLVKGIVDGEVRCRVVGGWVFQLQRGHQ
jgi:hypothetical protein